MFYIFITTFLVLVQTYLIFKSYLFISEFFNSTKIKKLSYIIFTIIISYLNLSFIVSIIIFSTKNLESSDLLFYGFLYPGGIWQGTSILLFFVFILKDNLVSFCKFFRYIIKKLYRFKYKEIEVDVSESRRKFLKGLSASLALPPIIGSIYGVTMQSSTFVINKKRINFSFLPDKLKGLKIAQLSDIHAGIYIRKKKILEAVEITNSLSPDIVALTGDYVSNSGRYIYQCIEALSLLKPKLGIYSCIGNHDNWIDRDLIIDGLKSAEIKILIDENQKIEHNGCDFYIAGTEDPWYAKPDLKKVLKDIPEDSFKILLTHQPVLFDDAEKEKVNLTLSGHTHGGQIAIPIFGMPISIVMLVTPYVRGLFLKNNSYLYVNSGIGFTGPPFRMNVPPEITLITLT